MSAMDLIYDKLNAFLGGSDQNTNQLFVMLMPGQIVDSAPHSYDDSASKPSLVADADSKLCNNMFDVRQIARTSNHQLVSDQYLTALQKFVPKVDNNLEEVRHQCRDRLAQKAEWIIDGKTYSGHRSEQFQALNNRWIEKRKSWDDECLKEKAALEEQHPGDPRTVAEKYNQWFQTVADSRLQEIGDAYDAIVIAFSPDEYGAMISTLDGGDGGRLEALRKQVRDNRKRSQTGGYSYPVDLSPWNWFESLKSSLHYTDLLSSPQHLALEIENKRATMREAQSELEVIGAMASGNLKEALGALKQAHGAYGTASNDLLGQYTDGVALAAKIYLEKKYGGDAEDYPDDGSAKTSEEDAQRITARGADLNKGFAKGGNGKKAPISAADVDNIAAQQKQLIAKQTAFMEATRAVGEAGLKAAEAESNEAIRENKALFQDLIDKTQEINALEQKYRAACIVDAPPEDRAVKDQQFYKADHGRFEHLDLSFSMDDVKTNSDKSSSFEETSWSVDVFFGSASGSESTSKSDMHSKIMKQHQDIEVSMLVTQVTVDRGWMSPGVFTDTADFWRLASNRIAAGAPSADQLKTPGALAEYDTEIFPSYPVSFLIAKDISISFELNEACTEQANDFTHHHFDAGGGIFCFSVSKVQDNKSEHHSFASHIEGTKATIKIPGPEILGWVIQCTPEDQSQKLDDQAANDMWSFVEGYRQVQEEAHTRQ